MFLSLEALILGAPRELSPSKQMGQGQKERFVDLFTSIRLGNVDKKQHSRSERHCNPDSRNSSQVVGEGFPSYLRDTHADSADSSSSFNGAAGTTVTQLLLLKLL